MTVKSKTFEKLFANSHYETDFEFAIQFNRRLLTPMGMWPMNLKSSKAKRISKFLNIVCIFFLLFLVVPGCIDITFVKNLQEGLQKVGPLSFTIMNLLFYFLLLIHREKICICLETMCDDWQSANQMNREIMLKNVSWARNFIIICSSFAYGGSLSFTLFFPLVDNFASSDNVTILKPAIDANFLLFDCQVRPYCNVVFCLQLLGSFICCSLTSGICSIAISFIMHISGQLEILTGFLYSLVNEPPDKLEITDRKIAFIVQRHLRSLRFAEQLENIMNEICLIEFFNSSFGICLIGYYIASEFQNNDITRTIVYVILLFSYVFNIFIYCFLSELLLTKCEDVGRQAYMIQWNSLPRKKALDLIPIILISSKPAKLTAGKLVSFSIDCFCTVMKASAAYLNFLSSFLK